MKMGSGILMAAVLAMSGCNVADLCRQNLDDKLAGNRDAVDACVLGAKVIGPSVKEKMGIPTAEQAKSQCEASCSSHALNSTGNNAKSVDEVLAADKKRSATLEKACSDGCVGYFIYERSTASGKVSQGKIIPSADAGDMRYPGGGTRMIESRSGN